MKPIAVITLSATGAEQAGRLVKDLKGCDLFVHGSVARRCDGTRFDSVRMLTRQIFRRYKGLVYVLPCGVAVRAIDGFLKGKKEDPAVVVVDVGGRYAISLLSGHEGGANDLALQVANCLGAEPVITTTTEAEKSLIVGVGCRRGISADAVVSAIKKALGIAKARIGQVRFLATVDIKKDEAGLLKAAARLGVGLRFISSGEIRSTARSFQHSSRAARLVKLPAVAEPAALLAGRRTRLVLRRIIHHGVTVAIARENCL